MTKYSKAIQDLEKENETLKSTHDFKKNTSSKNIVTKNKKIISFITAYIDVVGGKTYQEVSKNISTSYDKNEMTNDAISKKFKDDFPAIAEKFDIPFFMPAYLRLEKYVEDITEKALNYYGLLSANEHSGDPT